MLRIKHYIKNLFVFVPLLFSMNFTNKDAVMSSILVFIEFCLIASCIYIVNDIKDIDKDRAHPKKKDRPIASGAVPITTAKVVAIVLMLLAIGIAYVSNKYYSFITIGIYFVLNLAYTFFLKKVPLVDVFVIALGFLMRIYAGAFAIDVKVSSWLLMTTLALSLFLGFGKRYGEKIKVGDNTSRDVLDYYQADTLKTFIVVSMLLTIVFYSLYCAIGPSALGEYGIFTIPVVIFAMLRYYMMLDNKEVDGDPTDALLNDRVIQVCVVLYLMMIIIIWR